MKNRMTKMALKLSFLAFVLSACSLNAQANQDSVTTKVADALSGHHADYTTEKLLSIAGNESSLVNALIELRTSETIPFVAIRSEKLLLKFANRPEVAETLRSDMQNPNYRGLAGTIAMHIDQIEDQVVRRSLAQLAVSRTTKESEFKNYVSSFNNSNDPEVRKLTVGN